MYGLTPRVTTLEYSADDALLSSTVNNVVLYELLFVALGANVVDNVLYTLLMYKYQLRVES